MLVFDMDRELTKVSEAVEEVAKEISNAFKINELRILHKKLLTQGLVLENLIEIAKIQEEED